MKRGLSTDRFCFRGHDTFVVGRTKQKQCKECRRINHKKWSQTNGSGRNSHWKFQGIKNINGEHFTTVDFDRLYQIQQGKCAICGIHQSALKKTLAVDHNHATGIVRGLLCFNCNSCVVKLLENSNDLVAKAQIYLNKTNG